MSIENSAALEPVGRALPREHRESSGRPGRPAPPSRKAQVLIWLRWLLTPVLMVLALLVGGSIFLSLASLKELPPQVEPATRVYRVPVFLIEDLQVRPLQASFGTGLARQRVTIAAEVAGRIVETHRLDVGETVATPPPRASAGQTESETAEQKTDVAPIVRIDPDTYRQRVLQAQSMLAQDAAELEKLTQEVRNNRELLAQRRRTLASAEEQLKLQQRLLTQGAGRETEFRRVELEYQQYESAVLQLEIELKLEEARRMQIEARQAAHQQDLALAHLDLQRSEVFAPFPGVISRVMVELGQYVRAGDPLFELTNLSRVEVPLAIPISQSGQLVSLLAAGEEPRVQLAEHESAECRWVGRVTRIAPVADQSTRTVNVYAEVENDRSDDPLRPGTFVHARIELGEQPAMRLVPRDALVNGGVFVAAPANSEPDQSQRQRTDSSAGAAVGHNALAEWSKISVSGALGAYAIVSAGLAPGEHVVLTNLDILKSGTALSIVDVRTVQLELQKEVIPPFEVVESVPLVTSPE